jgi:GNAT superfamily N-acetyltransferase
MEDLTPAGDRTAACLSAPAPLSADHELEQFDCGIPALNDWLKHRAAKNDGRFSRTYVVCVGQRVVAYYCISAGMVERASTPTRLRRNAPDSIPVSVIGRLAVDRDWAGRGLGADLLADALRRIALAAQTVGIAAALVQAKDDNARQFYLHCAEFEEFPTESRTLFMPIETVLAGFG